jgi:hypothetical protein
VTENQKPNWILINVSHIISSLLVISNMICCLGTVDSDDSFNSNLSMVIEPGQDLSYSAGQEQFPNANSLPYILHGNVFHIYDIFF